MIGSQVVFVVVLVVELFATGFTQPNGAGFGFRVNRRGLDFFTERVIDEIRSEINSQIFDPIIDDSGSTRYSITELRASLNTGTNTFSTIHPDLISLSLSGASVDLRGDYTFSRRFFGTWIRDSGTLRASVSNIGFILDVQICSNSNGEPTFTATRCSASVGDVDFNNSGIIGLVLNIFGRVFRRTVRRFMAEQICEATEKAVLKDGQRFTTRYRVSRRGPEGTRFNAGFIGCVSANFNGISAFIRGNSYCRSQNPSQTYPVPAPPLPSFSPSSKMVQALLSQHTLNTLTYSLWQKGAMSRTFSEEELLSLFNVDQETVLAVAGGFGGSEDYGSGGTYQYYGVNSPGISVTVEAPQPPNVTIDESGITFQGILRFSAPLGPNGNDLEINLNLIVTGSVFVNNTRLQGVVSFVNATATSISGIDASTLSVINRILQAFMPILVRPLIDEFIDEGLTIPEPLGYRAVRHAFEMKQTALEISADIEYAG